jgi:Flp pilus assembly protein TadG
MSKQTSKRGLLSDRRGVAAVEFAMIAPALIFLVMGVLEMSFRFRASEEATRYVHQVADLVSREDELTIEQLGKIYGAAPFMMKPLETTDNLDLDIASIGFQDDEPKYFWRRVAGTPVDFELERAAGMGLEGETVIRVGVRYTYESVLSNLFGGSITMVEREAFARPRIERVVTMDGADEDGGEVVYFGPEAVPTG